MFNDDNVFLTAGAYFFREDGMCAVEYAAYLAGEQHTTRPECVSPYLASVAMCINDAVDDETRQRLKAYAQRMLGTYDDGHEDVRVQMFGEWLKEHNILSSPTLAVGYSMSMCISIRHNPESAFALLERMLDPTGLNEVPSPAVDKLPAKRKELASV